VIVGYWAHRGWSRGDLNARPKSLILLRHDPMPKEKPQQLIEVAGVFRPIWLRGPATTETDIHSLVVAI
jgi:hypothetical protein